MINHIYSNSRYIVANSTQNAMPYINPTTTMAGMIRYNHNNIEVFDGYAWQPIVANSSSVSLTSEAESLLDWAREQRAKQMEIESMALSKPAVQAAIDNLNKAKTQLEATVILSRETV